MPEPGRLAWLLAGQFASCLALLSLAGKKVQGLVVVLVIVVMTTMATMMAMVLMTIMESDWG